MNIFLVEFIPMWMAPNLITRYTRTHRIWWWLVYCLSFVIRSAIWFIYSIASISLVLHSIGLFLVCISYALTHLYSPMFETPLPSWLCVYAGITLFCYQTIGMLHHNKSRARLHLAGIQNHDHKKSLMATRTRINGLEIQDHLTHTTMATWVFFPLTLHSTMPIDNLDGRQARRTKSSSPLGLLFDHGIDALNTTLGMMVWTHQHTHQISCILVTYLINGIVMHYC